VPVDLATLLAPTRSALLMMECQEGVIGVGARLGALAEAVARHGTVATIAHVLTAARRAGVPVFHCLMARRPDGGGAAVNCRLLAATRKGGAALLQGSPAQAPVAPLAPADGDWVLDRYHGVTPFHGTELDMLLRNLGVATVVATGVSVNVGILGLTIEAVNAGYQVVIPRDGVAGTPDAYVEAVFENTLGLLATVTDAAAIANAWSRHA
jgi:nicotinamidase-related amidase